MNFKASNRQVDEGLRESSVSQSHPLLFVTISGAPLYGFPSADSDHDRRGEVWCNNRWRLLHIA